MFKFHSWRLVLLVVVLAAMFAFASTQTVYAQSGTMTVEEVVQVLKDAGATSISFEEQSGRCRITFQGIDNLALPQSMPGVMSHLWNAKGYGIFSVPGPCPGGPPPLPAENPVPETVPQVKPAPQEPAVYQQQETIPNNWETFPAMEAPKPLPTSNAWAIVGLGLLALAVVCAAGFGLAAIKG